MAAIIFISKKDFKKEGKSLAKWAEYQLLDATDADALCRTYSHCESTEGFHPSKEVWKPVEKDTLDSDYDLDLASLESGRTSKKFTEKQKEAQKKYLKSRNFMMGFGLCLDIITRTKGTANVYVILKNGVYKHFASKMAKRMEKIMSDQVGKFVYLWKELDESDSKKSILTNQIPDADLERIKEMSIAINKEYRE